LGKVVNEIVRREKCGCKQSKTNIILISGY
jgi:hypothetical protein